MITRLLLIALLAAIAVMMGKNGVVGLRSGRAAVLMNYFEWGPYDRRAQPKRFWFAILWSFGWTAVVFFGVLSLVGGDEWS